MSYPHDNPIVVIINIDGFMVKMILVDSGSSYNVLTWEVVVALQVNLTGLKKEGTPLVGIRGKSVNIKGSVELLITLGDKDRRRTLRLSFMVTR